MSTEILFSIHIITCDNGAESHMPSAFYSGAGNGFGCFQCDLLSTGYPGTEALLDALRRWGSDIILMWYDEIDGLGRFVVIDGYAPEPGEEIPLTLDPVFMSVEAASLAWWNKLSLTGHEYWRSRIGTSTNPVVDAYTINQGERFARIQKSQSKSH